VVSNRGLRSMTMKTWIALFFAVLTTWAAIVAANALSAALELGFEGTHLLGVLAAIAGFFGGVFLLWKYEGPQ
jgi:hypothetical protein